MSDVKVLHDAEVAAISEGQIVTKVFGGGEKLTSNKKKLRTWGATGAITLILVILMVFLGSGFLIPVGVYERLIEATDVSRADAVESQIIVVQQALKQGELPENTQARLKENGAAVGRVENGGFTEAKDGNAVLYNGRVVTAAEFQTAVNSDAGLYSAVMKATYMPAAYYYDEAAKEVFRKIGSTRNNYSAGESFEETTAKLMGEGSNISVNTVELVAREEDGETKHNYETIGETASSRSSAIDFVDAVRAKNFASDSTTAALNSADTLNLADTIAKEQRSSLFFLSFMENVAKMKYGEGNEAKVNEAMNMLYEEAESEVVDVATGEVTTVKGSMADSPSLYAILSGERVNTTNVANYSSDRILHTVENSVGRVASSETLTGTIGSTESKIRGSLGRFIGAGNEVASLDTLAPVVPTVEKSLVDNSFSTVKGVAGGELLVEGAVNVGKRLALASGGTVGNGESIKQYARLTSDVLALEAEADRMSRSPLDASSPNTFLGNIVYKLGSFTQGGTGLLSIIGNFDRVASDAIMSFAGAARAEDNADSYLAQFGDCTTLKSIGAEGSATCSAVITFDTTTLGEIIDDTKFQAFVEENTELSGGMRRVKNGSKLAEFILYNDERVTPIGVTDGGILASVKGGASSIPFISNIISLVENFLSAEPEALRKATGEAYVNSASNGDWDTYKYAQRYVALARATSMLRQYDGGATAYNAIPYFEGSVNPVVAFLDEYYAVAQR